MPPMPPLDPPTPKRPYHLTPAGRRALQASAGQHQRWLKSTGPRTPPGKAIASQNGLKHGLCSRRNPAQHQAYLAHLRRMRNAAAPPPDPVPPPIW